MPLTGNRASSALATPWQHLRVQLDPSQLLVDTFDSSIDLNQWVITNGGGGVLPAYSTASATLNSGTTANGWSKMVSVPTFSAEEPGWVYLTARINIEFPVLQTGYRFWGFGNPQASPTIASPMVDAVGFEIGTNGKLFAVTYAAGTRLVIADLTTAVGLNPQGPAQPQDSAAHKYFIYFRPDQSYWMIDDIDNVVASFLTGASGPNVNNLPFCNLAVSNGGTAVTIVNNGCATGDTGRNNIGLSDAVYSWKGQRILSGGEFPITNAIGSYPQPTNIAYAATTDTAFLAANANRRMAIISNDTTAKLYLLVDPSGAAAASATNFTYVVPAGATFEFPNPVSTARIRGFWAAGGAGSAGVTDISNTTTVGGA